MTPGAGMGNDTILPRPICPWTIGWGKACPHKGSGTAGVGDLAVLTA